MEFLALYLFYAVLLNLGLWRNGLRSPSAIARRAGDPEIPGGRILVIGATGGTGRELVRQALARGYEVTAFVRTPSRLKIEHPHLTVARGDVLDYPSVERAVRGQDAVLSALGHKRYFYPNRILSRGTENVLRAMEAEQVPRFVCESSLGIGSSAGRLGLYYTFFTIPVILPFYFWDKTRQEQRIAASGTAWTVVRPGVLTNGPQTGTCRHGAGVGSYWRTVRISRADVAGFMIDQVADDRYLGTATGISRKRPVT